jgi:hypothetical protein
MKHIVLRLATLRKELTMLEAGNPDKWSEAGKWSVGRRNSIRKWESWREALEAAIPSAPEHTEAADAE